MYQSHSLNRPTVLSRIGLLTVLYHLPPGSNRVQYIYYQPQYAIIPMIPDVPTFLIIYTARPYTNLVQSLPALARDIRPVAPP